MKKSLLEKIIFCMFFGILIFLIVPMVVVVVTTANIINVNTDSQWVSFWGNYLGALIGGGISGGITLYVLVKTLSDNAQNLKLTFDDNKKAQDRKEIVDFCNYLISKKTKFAQEYENSVYKANLYKVFEKNPQKNKESCDTYIEFINAHHMAKATLYEIMEQLHVRGDDKRYHVSSLKSTIVIVENTYKKFRDFEQLTGNEKNQESFWEEVKAVHEIAEKCLSEITLCTTELLSKDF